MNIKPIKGHTNIQTLNTVVQGIGGMTREDLEQQIEWLRLGVKAARGKINNALSKQRGAKYIIKHRATMPKDTVRLALLARDEARQAETEAIFERDRMLEQYRNFRSFLYIQKSMEMIVSEK